MDSISGAQSVHAAKTSDRKLRDDGFSGNIIAVCTLHRLLSGNRTAGERQAFFLTRWLVEDLEPDVPGAVGGVGASLETGPLEGEVVILVNGPALHLQSTTGRGRALGEVTYNALAHARTVDQELLHDVTLAVEVQLLVLDVEDGILPHLPVSALGVELIIGKVQGNAVLRGADACEMDWGGGPTRHDPELACLSWASRPARRGRRSGSGEEREDSGSELHGVTGSSECV
jgi:hypothetical protein